jgi:hypothetical protein
MVAGFPSAQHAWHALGAMTDTTDSRVDAASDLDAPELPPWLRKWLVFGLGLFVVWGVVAWPAWQALNIKREWLGAWGDSFAPLTGIASTLAVVFAVWSVHMPTARAQVAAR